MTLRVHQQLSFGIGTLTGFSLIFPLALLRSYLSEGYKDRITSASTLDQLWEHCKQIDSSSSMASAHKPCYKVSKVGLLELI
eukprot:1139848-Pelagomonas_calceolata.AAC.6